MPDIKRYTPTTVALTAADAAIDAGLARGAELGSALTITVIDAGGYLVAAKRMDGAALAAIETSATKATTSLLFATATKDLTQAAQPGGSMFAMMLSVQTPLAFGPGGLPITDEQGLVIGAIGVGGGPSEHDQEVAETVLAALRA